MRPGSRLAALLAELPGSDVVLARLPLVLTCALVVPLVAAGVHFVSQARYVSEARLLLKLGREYQAPAGPSDRTGSMYRLNEAINSEVEILSSHGLAREVVSTLGPTTIAPKLEGEELPPEIVLEKASRAFLESLSVSGIAESSVIRVAFAAPDPELSRRALEVLLAAFHERHLGVFVDGEAGIAQEAHRRAAQGLAEAEARRAAYWDEHGLFDPAEERALLLRRRDEIDGRRRALEVELATLAEGREPMPGDAGAASPVDDQLLALRAEEARLLNNYREDSATVRTVRSQIAGLEELLERQARQRTTSVTELLDALAAERAELEAGLVALRGHDAAVRELERGVAAAEVQLAEARSRLRAAQAQGMLDAEGVTSVRVFDAPTLPLEPMGASLPAKVVLGLMAGLLLGVGAAVGLHLLEHAAARRDAPGFG